MHFVDQMIPFHCLHDLVQLFLFLTLDEMQIAFRKPVKAMPNIPYKIASVTKETWQMHLISQGLTVRPRGVNHRVLFLP